MNGDFKSQILTPANIVTIIRIVAIPVYVAVLIGSWPQNTADPVYWASMQPIIATVIFIIISFTDFVDGKLARSRGEVTDFGKFLDPLADKILVCAALLCLVQLQTLSTWVALVILAREFIISGLRMLAATQGTVIAASYYGKIKTWTQIIAIIAVMLKESYLTYTLGESFYNGFGIFTWIVVAIAVIMTILSMIDYFSKGRAVFGFKPYEKKSK